MFVRTWQSAKVALMHRVYCDVNFFKSKAMRSRLSKQELQNCVLILQSREFVKETIDSGKIADSPLFRHFEDMAANEFSKEILPFKGSKIASLPMVRMLGNPVEWIQQNLSANELGEHGHTLRITLKVPRGNASQGILLLDGIVTSFVEKTQEAVPGSVARQGFTKKVQTYF